MGSNAESAGQLAGGRGEDSRTGNRLQPILHQRFTDPIPTVRATHAEVDESAQISDVVRLINKLMPDHKMKHLKKIRRSESGQIRVLLGRDEVVQQHEHHLKSLPIRNLQSTDVPLHQPLTRTQFNLCKQLWPTSFHEDQYIRQCMDGTRFSSSELDCIGKHYEFLRNRCQATGSQVALIVSGDVVLADEISDSDSHPLRHACLLALDSIARHQVKGTSSEGAYVCTEFDAFLSQEVCLMCAMALLHSRIRRVFLCTGFSKSSCPPDKPFSRLKLHAMDSLNHRFEVWTVIQEKGEQQVP